MLAVTAGLSMVVAVCFLPVGALFTFCSRGDLRRWRDWRTATGNRYDGVTMFGPTFLRLGALGLVLGVGSVLAHAAFAIL